MLKLIFFSTCFLMLFAKINAGSDPLQGPCKFKAIGCKVALEGGSSFRSCEGFVNCEYRKTPCAGKCISIALECEKGLPPAWMFWLNNRGERRKCAEAAYHCLQRCPKTYGSRKRALERSYRLDEEEGSFIRNENEEFYK
eukprot:TCONS_00024049-protein